MPDTNQPAEEGARLTRDVLMPHPYAVPVERLVVTAYRVHIEHDRTREHRSFTLDELDPWPGVRDGWSIVHVQPLYELKAIEHPLVQR